MTTTVLDERRDLTFAAAGVELRAGDPAAATSARFIGLAMQYGVRAAIGDPKSWGFFEEFAPASAARSLGDFDQRMLIDHDTYYLVSRTSAGDLTLLDTARGVEVDSELDLELSYVRDLHRNVEKRRITGMSIGFRVAPGGAQWEQIEVEEPRPDGKIEVYQADLRLITEIDLIEVSAVTFPAYVDTEADLRHRVVPALIGRGDPDAIARRAAMRPELADLLPLVERQHQQPSTSARRDDVDRIMRGYQARYPRLSNSAR